MCRRGGLCALLLTASKSITILLLLQQNAMKIIDTGICLV